MIDLERELRRGQPYDQAVTALAFDRAVVTRNEREYRRVPGSRVYGYR